MQTKMDEEKARKITPKQTKEKKMALSDLQLKRMAARIQIIIDNHSRACSRESKSGSSNTDSNRSRREEPSTSMQTKMDEEEARKITPKQTKEKKMVLSDLQLKRMAARIQIIIDNHSRACSLESKSGSSNTDSKRSRREELSTSVRVSKTRVKHPKRKHSSKNAGSVNANSGSTRPKRVLKPRSYTYMATEESIDEEFMDDDSEVNYCDCGREFTNMAQLERHRLKCNHKDSDYEFKESSDSENELSAEKSGESSTIKSESDVELYNEHYACYCCDKSFKVLINLIKHSCNKVNKGKNRSKDEVFHSTIVQEVDVVETLSNNEEESSNGKTDKDNQIDGIEVKLDSTASKTDVQEVDVDETSSNSEENGNNCKADRDHDYQIDGIELNLDSTAGKLDVQGVDVYETPSNSEENGNNCKVDKDHDNQMDGIEVNLDSTTGKTDLQEVNVDGTTSNSEENGNNCKADKDHDNQMDGIEVTLDSTTGKTDLQEVNVDGTTSNSEENGNNCKTDKDNANQMDGIEVNLESTTGKLDLHEVNVDETTSNSEENGNNCKADKDHDNQMDGIEVNLDSTTGKLDLQEIDANETLSNSVVDNVEEKDGIKELCNGESGGDNQVDSIDKNDVQKIDETLPINPNDKNENDDHEHIINQDGTEISASEIDEKTARRLQENEIAAEIEKQVTSGTCVFARINRNGEIIKTKRIVLNKKYICTECNQKLQSATDFACHQLRHENERASVSYECKACQETFCIEADLQLHENQIHSGEHLPYKCPHCEKRYKSLTEADIHLLRTHDKFSGHFPYKCQECSAVLQSPSRFQKHMEVHANQKLREKFSCKSCERTFLCPSKLRKHILTHKKYACEICGKTFSMRRLGVHMESHATVKRFECPVCKKRFSQSSNRSKHMRIHTGEKPYECNICQKTFNHKVSLKTHKKSKHNIDWWADNGVMKVQVSAEEKRILRLLGKKT
ncbi:uncharacterized protein [Antedon mediterranea]|uniref:uncharacterized protein isoform X2 n=1 Tax=Antedon mediterranea TaxID=105859 RepID=UPI003AF647B7